MHEIHERGDYGEWNVIYSIATNKWCTPEQHGRYARLKIRPPLPLPLHSDLTLINRNFGVRTLTYTKRKRYIPIRTIHFHD